ncbi:T-cell surface glycoprotein CD1e, membrane-associated isoform X2 [Equus caballus]|uniref:T-cell surface glycoprotein CD1e, membrane-associated isoform 3 precursor n=1 Tax=Equus caballus TaxID=9796 RepID=UPI0038B2B9B6
MLLLLLLLFKGLPCHGASTVAPLLLGFRHPASEEPLSFRFVQVSSFANHSCAHIQASGWLGDVQTHVLDSVSGTIRFLRPWSQGTFSKQELKNLEALLLLYLHSFNREVQAFASQFQFEYPFELQVLSGCQMHAGKASESFLNGAYQGSDFLSFQGNSWKPSPGAGSRAQNVCRVLNHYRIIKEIVQSLLSDICPRFLAGLLEAGKSELEQQDGNSIFLMLICLTIIVTLVLLVVVDSWFRKQSSNQNILSLHVPNPAFSTRVNIQDPKNSGHQLCLAQEFWIKNRFLKNWKTSLKQLW